MFSNTVRRTCFIILIFAGLAGCQMTPRQLARNGSFVVLSVSGSDVDTANKVRSIAVQVRDALNEDGSLDRQKLLAQVDKQIAKLEPRERAIVILVRSQVVDIISDAIVNNQDVTEILIVIREVAEGTVEGVDLFIQSQQ